MELDGEGFIPASGRYKDLFALGDRLLTLALLATNQKTVEGAGPSGPRFGSLSVILGLLAKSVKTFRSIHLLCERGYSEDAHALLRSLGEAMATVTFIAQGDSEVRARQYLDFMSMQDCKVKNATEANPGLRGTFSPAMARIVNEIADDARARLTDDEYERRYGRSCWYPDGIEALMRAVGLQSTYDLPFRMSSRSVHATDLLDHIEWTEDRGLKLKLLPGDFWTSTVLHVSCVFFWLLLEAVNSFAGLGIQNELEDLKEPVMRAPRRPEPGGPDKQAT